MLIAKVKQTAKRFGMLHTGERIVVAVSGGPDSVCLLSALRALSGEFNISLHIAHLDHMFRGRESAEEALFVTRLATKLQVPITTEKIDVPAFCRERGLSPQEGARMARYDFFNSVAVAIGASRIATGHTADDQAETLIMRLLRGAGVSGLSAIPPVSGNIIRPLLEITRDEVLAYVKENGLAFVMDPSNSKPVYTRNKIRSDLIPVLKRFNPRIVETLAAEAAILREENKAMEDCLIAVTSGMIRQKAASVILMRDAFCALPQAFKRRLFKKVADIVSGAEVGLSLVQIDRALAFMMSAQTGRTLRLPYRLAVEREYETFIVSLHTEAEEFSHILALPGVTPIPELGMDIEVSIEDITGAEPKVQNFLWYAEFDYDKITIPLILRTRIRGDRFCPAGMGGRSKKLQDYLVDGKIPRRKRGTLPLLVAGDHLLWVVGLRTDGRFLPDSKTKKVLAVGVRSSEC